MPRLCTLLALALQLLPHAAGFTAPPLLPTTTTTTTQLVGDIAASITHTPKETRRCLRDFRLYAVESEHKLWNKLGIEEDDEFRWYLLNCMPSTENDLLYQCRIRCAGMKDAAKFVVPTVTSTRSHGPNRMVTEEKVKFTGYVFVKARMCPEVYEAIQTLDLCRSWMGTANVLGIRKQPPIPSPLSEEEIESYGLEDLPSEEEDSLEQLGDDDIIVDTQELDREDEEVERKQEEIFKMYNELRVNDMIQVTTNPRFKGEEGIVKRLKDGMIKVRFQTYGTIFDEWMKPDEVRKLSDTEVMRGLTGPSEPITQRDLDGFEKNNEFGPSKRNTVGTFGSRDSRSRREDRVASRFQRGQTTVDRRQNEENWNWYKENQREKSYGHEFSDGDWGIRGSRERYGDKKDGSWSKDDSNGQRGGNQRRQQKPPPRREHQNQRDGRRNSLVGNAVDGNADWNSFITPIERSPKRSNDGFFDSLMDDINKEQNDRRQPSRKDSRRDNRASSRQESQSDEDAFFSSLISEISDMESNNDDFFAAIANEGESPVDSLPKRTKRDDIEKQPSNSGEDDDFFASLEDELDDYLSSPPPSGIERTKQNTKQARSDNGDDFFSSLQSELDEELSGGKDSDTLLSDLEAKLSRFDPPKATQGRNPSARDAFSDLDNNDDFFADIAAELSDFDMPSSGSDKESKQDSFDDFFSDLVLDDEAVTPPSQKNKLQHPQENFDGNDDFFDSLDFEEEFPDPAPPKSDPIKQPSTPSAVGDDDDFFSDYEDFEFEEDPRPSPKKDSSAGEPVSSLEDEGVFLSDYEDFEFGEDTSDMAQPKNTGAKKALEVGSVESYDDGDTEFFSDYDNLEDKEIPESVPAPTPKATRTEKTSSQASSSPATESSEVNLQKCTVAVLKDMLRERGLKVSGKKAELIERLST